MSARKVSGWLWVGRREWRQDLLGNEGREVRSESGDWTEAWHRDREKERN